MPVILVLGKYRPDSSSNPATNQPTNQQNRKPKDDCSLESTSRTYSHHPCVLLGIDLVA